MNLPPYKNVTQLDQSSGSPVYDDEIHLIDLLDVVFDSRWLIAGITALALCIGFAYTLLSPPVYQTDILIQVEDTKVIGANGLLNDVSSMFDIKSPAVAEIEILRSRMVIGEAIANLHLDLEVTPKYIPLVGRWLARRATGLSEPGFLGMDGYVRGTEALQVANFTVPKSLEGKVHTVVLTEKGYQLVSPDGELLGQGTIGKSMHIQYPEGEGSLLVVGANGKAGAAFYVTRYSKADVIGQFQDKISIGEKGKQSGMIRSTLEGSDPLQISQTLNEIGRLYVSQNTQRKAAEAAKSLAFLETQLPQLRKELEESERKFNQYRSKNNVFDLEGEAKVMLDHGAKLHISLVELQQKRKEIEARFTSAHPSLQIIDNQINSVNTELDKLNSRARTFPSVEQDLLRLTRDVKVNNELYISLLNSVQQLRLVKEGRVGNVRLVDEAIVPELPVKPRSALIVVLSTVLGLIVGLGLSFARNNLRVGLKDPSEIEQHSSLRVLATIPHSEVQAEHAKAIAGKLPGNHVLAIQAPDDPVVESMRSLRTALQFVMLDMPSSLVLFTGPTQGVGKSFTSVNFATIVAAASKRVLLIDADLRKGHLNSYFGQGRTGGLSEVVSGSMAFGDAVRREVVPNVDFLSTGILPPNPAELLTNSATQALLKQVATQYDFVVLDAPPVLAASDAAILAPLVGAVFMLVRAEVTSLGELQEASKRLAQAGAEVRGVVFNDLHMATRRYSYGLGYRHGKYRYVNYEY